MTISGLANSARASESKDDRLIALPKQVPPAITHRMDFASSPRIFAGAEQSLKRPGSSAGHLRIPAESRAAERYRLKVIECEGRAAAATDAATRVNYHELAEYWSDMAREARDAEVLGHVHSWP